MRSILTDIQAFDYALTGVAISIVSNVNGDDDDLITDNRWNTHEISPLFHYFWK